MFVGLLAKTLVPFPSGEKCVGTDFCPCPGWQNL